MEVQVAWKKLLTHLAIWLVIEFIMTLTGLNDLSNYSEFVLQQNTVEFRRV